jgi:hypothetical protein
MKYADEMSWRAMIYKLSFIKICLVIQKFIWGYGDTQTAGGQNENNKIEIM